MEDVEYSLTTTSINDFIIHDAAVGDAAANIRDSITNHFM